MPLRRGGIDFPSGARRIITPFSTFGRKLKSIAHRYFGSWKVLAVTVVTFCIGIGVSLLIYFLFHNIDEGKLSTELKNRCDLRAQTLRAAFDNRIVDVVKNSAAFLHASSTLDQKIYGAFLEKSSFNLTTAYVTTYSTYLPHSKRQSFEAAVNSTIYQQVRQGEKERRPDQDFYCAVTYVYPYDDLFKTSVGFDVLSQDDRRADILSVLNATKPYLLSRPYILPFVGEPSFLIWYAADTQQNNVVKEPGLISMAFKLTTAFGELAKADHDVGIELKDIDTLSDGTRNVSILWQSFRQDEDYVYQYMTTVDLPVVNRNWELNCVPTRTLKNTMIPSWPIAISVIIAVIFCILSCTVRRSAMRFYHARKEIKRKESDLQKSQAICDSLVTYSKIVVQLIPDPVLLLNRDGFVIGLNSHAINTLGLTATELHSKTTHITDILESPLGSTAITNFRVPGVREVSVVRPDGSEIRVSINVSKLLEDSRFHAMGSVSLNINEGNEVDKISQVVILRDITERLQMMERLKANEERMRFMSEERKNMLLWLCHELRNPLHVMYSAGNLIRNFSANNTYLPPTDKSIILEHISATHASASYMRYLIDDILDFMGEGVTFKNTLRSLTERGGVEDLLKLVLDHVRPCCEPKGLVFELNYRNGLNLKSGVLSEAIFGTLYKILLNLCHINIRLHGPKSIITLDVSLSTLPSPSPPSSPTFSDSDKCPLNHLFSLSFPCTDPSLRQELLSPNSRPFSLEHISYGDAFGGHGLAIAIIAKHTESLNGSITANENVVTISVPIHVDLSAVSFKSPRLDSANDIIDDGNAEERSGREGRRAKVLVVEDNLLVQRVTKKSLEKVGYDVVVANDGVEAVEVLKVKNVQVKDTIEKVDFVFMDLFMPNLNGFDATEKIRKELNLNTEDLPVVALTANSMDSEKQRCLDSGYFNGFLTKPASKESLKEIIEEFCQK
ncbi:hypothetical protein BKA69DRAFT_1121070 [Paraphysoderma sedebokerense]|nr:hypothetical protein BKA69DRAFT_1121070 [Paraphysoderma sedebokerense]